MVEQITERFRQYSLNDQQVQCGLYKTTSQRRVEGSWSPVVTRSQVMTHLARGRSLDEATATNVFSCSRQSETSPSLSAWGRSLPDTPPFSSPRPQCQLCERDWLLNYPPNKRQCRSLSTPSTVTLRSVCHHVAAYSNLYRPVAVRPGSVGKAKTRHSPLNYTTRSHGNLLWQYQSVAGSSPVVRRSSSEFSSPPESPVPRPASVSSGYYDSCSSSSLAGLPWLEQQFSPAIFQKSLSMEESISGFHGVHIAPLASLSPPSAGGRRETKIPRCRSQPCVLTKSGVKRRREVPIQRPTIDFLKMKETAYHHSRRPRAHSASYPKDIRSPRNMLSVEEEAKVFGLKPILGSPLDSGQFHHTPCKLAHIAVSPSTSPTQEVDEEVEGINFNQLSGADSGCSADGDDPPHFMEYPNLGDYSPCGNDPLPLGDESVFPLDGLDLEQIEND